MDVDEMKFRIKITVQLYMNAALKHLYIPCSALGPLGATQGPHFKMCCFKAHRRLAALHEPETGENIKYVEGILERRGKKRNKKNNLTE